MTNAISLQDLDMSLHYFLDQVFVLETFTVGIFRYFDWQANPKQPLHERHVNGFI